MLLGSCGYARKDDKMMSAKEIIKLIDKGKPVLFFDKIITDDLLFTDAKNQVVDGNANLVHIVKNDVVFVNCVFLGKVFATKTEKTNHFVRFNGDVSFRKCDFREEVDFSDIVINGKLNMTQSVFREKVAFNGMHVKGNSSHFWEMTAEKGFSMVNSTQGRLNFMDAHFAKECNLQRTDCADLQFSNVQCDSLLELSMSSIRGNANINYGVFEGPVSLSYCKVIGMLDVLKSHFNGSFEIENTTLFSATRLTGSTFKGDIKSENCYCLIGPQMEDVKTTSPFKVNVVNSSKVEIK